MKEKIDLPKKVGYLIVIYIIAMILSIYYAQNVLLIIPTFIEIGIVLLYIAKDIRKAFFFHLLFIILSFDVTTGLGNDAILYSYYKLKLIGPIGINQIIGLIIFVLVYKRYPLVKNNSILYHSYKIFIYLMLSGSIIGFFGIIFCQYNLLAFRTPLIYIVTAIIYTGILLRIYTYEYSKLFLINGISMLIAAPIATAVCFNLLGVSFKYGTEDAFIYHEIYILAPSLLIALLQLKRYKLIVIFSLLCYCYNLYVGGRGVHFMVLAVACIIFIFMIYTTSSNRFIKISLPIIIFGIFTVIVNVASSASQLAVNKFTEMTSIINIIVGEEDLLKRIQYISESPLVRIGEFLNIIYEGLKKPIGLLFGYGFGGYFLDQLNIFANLTLAGAYSDTVIASGKFDSAHSVYPCALLYNGIIGLYLLLRLGIESLFKVKNCFMYMAGVILFCYTFYGNPVTLITCLFMLYTTFQFKDMKKISK